MKRLTLRVAITAAVALALSGCSFTRTADRFFTGNRQSVIDSRATESRSSTEAQAVSNLVDDRTTKEASAGGANSNNLSNNIRLAQYSQSVAQPPPSSVPPLPDGPTGTNGAANSGSPISDLSTSSLAYSESSRSTDLEIGATETAMTLPDFERLAAVNNPTLQALAATTQKAAGFRAQVSVRANPIIGYQGVQFADQGTDQHTAFFQQDFVTANKLQLNRQVLNQAVQAQVLELETQRWRVRTDVRTAFFEALAAQQRVQLLDEFQSVTDKGLELAELRKQAQEGSQIDVLQAKVQKNEVDLAKRQAEVTSEAAWRNLAALAGTPQLQKIPLRGDFGDEVESVDWNTIASQTLASSPERRAAVARVRQALANLDRQLVQAVPNLTMQFGAGVDNGTNSGLINLQVGAPIPVFNKNQGNIAAARAEHCRAVREVERIEAAIQARLALVGQQYDSAAAAYEIYQGEILPSATDSLRLAELAYQAGETGFIQVLVARRTLLDSRLALLRAQAELAQADARVVGFVLSGALDPIDDQSGDDSLRGQTFSQQ